MDWKQSLFGCYDGDGGNHWRGLDKAGYRVILYINGKMDIEGDTVFGSGVIGYIKHIIWYIYRTKTVNMNDCEWYEKSLYYGSTIKNQERISLHDKGQYLST